MKMRKKKKGFTLVELLVVIAIIGILAAVVTPNTFKAIEKSKVASAISDYKAIKTAALSYYSDTGTWPIDGANGIGFVNAPTEPSVNGWNGPYLERWPSKNPWGGKYVLVNNASTVQLELQGVNQNVRDRLDAELDGSDGNGAGIVKWTANNTIVTINISTQQ